jgi:phenylalanyl-tRNA synthetase beta chain
LDPAKTKNENKLDKYREHWKLTLFISGRKQPESWNVKEEKTDFYQIKAMVHTLLGRAGIQEDHFSATETDAPFLEYGLKLITDNKTLAHYGKVKKDILNHFDIKQEVFYAEIDWQFCLEFLASQSALTYTEIPRFPEVRRDLAMLLDKYVKFSQIEKLAKDNGGHLLRNISLFDVYEGEQIGQDKKSYAVSFILRDDNKTLKDEEIDAFMNKLVRIFERELNAKLR